MISTKPSFIKNISFATLGNIFFALSQWGIIVVLTKIGTTKDVGTLTLLTALVTPIFMLANMDMRNSHSADDLSDFSHTDYFTLRILSSLIAIVLVLFIAKAYLIEDGYLIQISAIAYSFLKFTGSLINMNHGFYQRAERMDFVARSLIFQGVFGLSLFTICYYFLNSLLYAFFAEALGWWLSLLLIDRNMLHKLKYSISFMEIFGSSLKNILRLAKWTIPLGFAVFMITAANSFPRLVLDKYVDISVLGIFGAIAYINIAINIVGNALGASSSFRLRQLYRNNNKNKFIKLTFLLVMIAGFLGCSILILVRQYGREILTFIYGEAYANSEIFEITILAAIIRLVTTPIQYTINAGHAFKRRFFNSLIVLAIAILTSAILIPKYGIFGAAWAMVALSATSLFLALIAYLNILYKFQPLSKNNGY